jgi:flagellar FliL protein
MSTKTTDKTPAVEAAEGESSGGRRKVVLVLVVALLLAAGVACYFLFAGSGEAEAAEPEHGGYVALEPIAVNLAGGGYLKIAITLDVTVEGAAGGGHGGGGLDGAKAYDSIISTFSQAQPADVTSARDALKEALEEKIIEAYTEDDVPLVKGIYYTEYVTQ